MSNRSADNLKCAALLAALFGLALWVVGCHAPEGLPTSINQTDSNLNKAEAYADAAFQQSHEGPVKRLIEKASSCIAEAIDSNFQTAKAFVLEHKARSDAEANLRALEAKPYVKAGRFCERAWKATVRVVVGFFLIGGTLFVLQFIWPPIFGPLFKIWLGILKFILDLLPKIFHRVVDFLKGRGK